MCMCMYVCYMCIYVCVCLCQVVSSRKMKTNLVNANMVIWARVSDIARPETAREPKGNITDDPSRCIHEDAWYKVEFYISIITFHYE